MEGLISAEIGPFAVVGRIGGFMRGRLTADIREEIRQRVDLVELASAHVSLKKAGRHYKGLCPFHQEKTPSFHIDRERGLWHCFGCGEGGDIFDFVMRISSLSFTEAAETLARRAGVRLERSPEEVQQATERDRLYRALEAAVGFFREQLLHPEWGRVAREYLQRRGVDVNAAERFRLGYATPNWDDLLTALGTKGFPAALLSGGGLVHPRSTGDGYYDMFRHRLIFPILDLQDRPVAFGGRALDETSPKYLNSRETAVFVKGRTLYALNWAREAIRQHDEVVVVEGNMDAVTCHQFGITNAVASLGTALTPEQVLALKRFASRAVLVYDADAAGQAAMERAMTLFEEADLPVRVVVLPSGDPDAFLRTEGPQRFQHLLAQAGRLLVHLMVHEPALRRVVGEALSPDDFQDARYRDLARALYDGPDDAVEGIRQRIDDDGQRLLMQLVFEDPPVVEKEKEKVVKGAIDFIMYREPAAQHRLALARQIQQAQTAGDLEQVRRLQMEYLKLIGLTPAEVPPSRESGQGQPSRKGGEDDGQEEGGA